jgi:hypothetical protein
MIGIQISPKAEHVKRHIVEKGNADMKFLTTDSWIIQHHEVATLPPQYILFILFFYLLLKNLLICS